MRFQVTAVVVSYNRQELLGECLGGLLAQTRRPDRVIVVDNASTDNAVAVARAHALHPEIVQLHRNVGGAGGFCAGLAEAVRPLLLDYTPEGADTDDTPHYLWVMDDDTIPTPDALARLLHAVAACVGDTEMLPTVLGSKALWTDGREHLMNKPRPRTFVRKGPAAIVGVPDSYQVRSLSFVSCLINAGAVIGTKRLPRAAYFLWNDDFEFTTGLLKRGLGYYVPTSEVVHKTKVFGSSDADPGPRFYNEVRNKIWMARFSRDIFFPVEFAEFVLKTVRRWILTFVHGSDRRQLLDCLVRGWHDGWRTRPESNLEIFDDTPEIESALEALARR
ncbi:glycosyltransferase [Bifidobacterium choloepi]|uniref:Glycosyltransferase n=1 Tax=Bifidobacterium choloepi TaxID=2614131 RepID=A0A6I5NGT1_9BIFI|nr:glycosyltransferase [Bifidobacterium choloepi]NEG70474.1 glycosyltransferase [Bifidobacterium choloepi]